MGTPDQRANGNRYIILVSYPNDPLVADLINELHQLGWSAIRAETADKIMQGALSAACVVIVTARLLKDPILTAVMQSDPINLIPVMVESLPLPKGFWTHQPIDVDITLNDVARQIVDSIKIQDAS